KHLELLRGRVKRMQGLIDGLLQFSRVDREPQVSNAIDTRALALEVVDLLNPPPDVKVHVQEEMPIVGGSQVQLQQVLMNLIGNAIKHREPERPLNIHVRAR